MGCSHEEPKDWDSSAWRHRGVGRPRGWLCHHVLWPLADKGAHTLWDSHLLGECRKEHRVEGSYCKVCPGTSEPLTLQMQE